MLPVSVLPIAGILLGSVPRISAGCPPLYRMLWQKRRFRLCKHATDFCDRCRPRLTNNDGVSALAAVVAYGIMVKPWPWLRHWYCIYLLKKSPLTPGGYWRTRRDYLRCDRSVHFNRFYRIKLPEYLGFFAGKRLCRSFLAWLPSLLALCCPSLAADWFCNPDLLSVGCLPEPVVAFGIYGFIERCLVPFGLHTSGTYLSRCRLVNTPTQQVSFPRRHSALYGG